MNIPPNKKLREWHSHDELIKHTTEYLTDSFHSTAFDEADKIVEEIPTWFKNFNRNRMKRIQELREDGSPEDYLHAVSALHALHQQLGHQYFVAHKLYQQILPAYNQFKTNEHAKLMKTVEMMPGKIVEEMELYYNSYLEYMKHAGKNFKAIEELL